MLAAALAAHDLEEALAYPRLRPAIREILAFAPPVSAAWAALGAVTVAGAALALWAGRGAGSAAKTVALRGVALILLANVLIPHVPAAVMLGGYAPGVVTAVAINLPAGLLALALLRGSSAPIDRGTLTSRRLRAGSGGKDSVPEDQTADDHAP